MVLHGDTSPGDIAQEREADTFAAEFLTPRDSIASELPSRAYIRLRNLNDAPGFGMPEPLTNFPGEQPALLAKGFSLACDHGLTIADLADELAWDLAGVRRVLGAQHQRPVLRLVPDIPPVSHDAQSQPAG